MTTELNYRTAIMPTVLQGLGAAQGRPAPTLDQQMQSQFRNQQTAQMGQLNSIATGQTQGAGELAVQRQVANQIAAQQAQARMGRGAGAGLAQRQAMRQTGAVGLSGAGMGQQAALGDQMAAHGLLAQAAGQGRGQDINMSQMNLEAQLRQQQMNDQYQQMMLDPLVRMQIAERQGVYGVEAGKAAQPGWEGYALGAAGQIGAAIASDERLKEDISDASGEVDDMLDRLVAKSYRYKDPKYGEGPRAGIMAQDMLKSKAGARVVRQHKDGLALDLNAAISAALASSARLNERLRKVERKKVA